MDLRSEFDAAIRESLEYTGHLNKNRPDGKYYEDAYAQPIRDYFESKKRKSYELNYSEKYKCTPICALASSGRLCYLHFRYKEGAEFETALSNGICASRPTYMDAVIGDTYYECKCQEILYKSHSPLRRSYLESELFKKFEVKNYTINNENLVFDVRKLNIKMKGDNDYARLHFDLKQLICHLIAIANNNNNTQKVLQYVFFKPNREVIKKYPRVEKLYEELDAEIKAICASDTAISKFAEKHYINIAEPVFIELKDVKDFVYEDLYLNN